MEQADKKVDVVMPTYNQSAFILEAIKSIESQTYKPENIFIVDDGSNDDTEKIVSRYKSISKIPVTYFKKENGGPNSARNLGLKNSNAEFVAFLDADDVWRQDKLEKQIEIFQNKTFPNLGLVYAKYDLIDKNGENFLGKIVELDTKMRGAAFEKVIRANKILGSASNVLIKREAFSQVGLFDEKLRFSEDWDMWIRISEKYDIDFSNETLVHIRRHDKNTSNNAYASFVGEIEFFNKWGTRLSARSIPDEWRERMLTKIIKGFPKNNLRNVLVQKMNKDVYKKIFPSGIGYLVISKFALKKLIRIFRNYGK